MIRDYRLRKKKNCVHLAKLNDAHVATVAVFDSISGERQEHLIALDIEQARQHVSDLEGQVTALQEQLEDARELVRDLEKIKK